MIKRGHVGSRAARTERANFVCSPRTSSTDNKLTAI